MKKSREERRWAELELIDKLAKYVYDKDWIDFLIKDIDKYEEK